jgi:glutathione synthase/RimK-type ligase-like ATP-grasp enzyme
LKLPPLSPTTPAPNFRIAFATWSGAPDLSDDDRLLADACGARGLIVRAQPWDVPCDWRSFSAVVVRTTWNYHLHPQRFTQWIDELERLGVSMWNPPSVIKWNMHKRYLTPLAGDDVRVPAMVMVPQGTHASLEGVLAERRWRAAVVKPAISANAYQTEVITSGGAHTRQAEFEEWVKERDMLVQELVPEIVNGELSLMFMGGRFSHAVRKIPSPGEYRVQESLGGTAARIEPDQAQIDRCSRVLSQVPGPTLYARVDGVPVGDAFVLLEVEVIEPSLFVSFANEAADAFAAALCRLDATSAR